MAEKEIKETYWVRCPICRGKTRTKVYADSVLVKFPLYFPKCKHTTCIDVVDRKLVCHSKSNI